MTRPTIAALTISALLLSIAFLVGLSGLLLNWNEDIVLTRYYGTWTAVTFVLAAVFWGLLAMALRRKRKT